MDKNNVSQRKGGAEKGGGGNEIALPEIKIDPKMVSDALFFAPSFLSVTTGDRFITTLSYYNSARHRVNEAEIWLRYNPAALTPLWADTSPMTSGSQTKVQSEFWPDLGIIHINARFAQTPKGDTVSLADLHWRAVAPAMGARIELAAPKGKTVAMYEGKTNLVAGDQGYNKQKVNAEVNITPEAWDEPGLRTVEQVDAMMPAPPLGKAERLRLAIVSPNPEVATGAVATADVALINPKGLAFDDLKLRIRFDPTAVTILDADQDNYIADGLNIFDGDFHEKFPFDGHIRNQVDPERGIIEYQVGSVMGPKAYPSGVFARIVYRMKRQAGKAAFWFEVEDSGLQVRTTDVTAAGRSLLGEGTAVANAALHGVEVGVKPLELGALGKPTRRTTALAEAR